MPFKQSFRSHGVKLEDGALNINCVEVLEEEEEEEEEGGGDMVDSAVAQHRCPREIGEKQGKSVAQTRAHHRSVWNLRTGRVKSSSKLQLK